MVSFFGLLFLFSDPLREEFTVSYGFDFKQSEIQEIDVGQGDQSTCCSRRLSTIIVALHRNRRFGKEREKLNMKG